MVDLSGAWGYEPRFEELREKILSAVPEANVTGIVGRRSSFEVRLNNVYIFSKLSRGGFPKIECVVEEAVKAKKGLPNDQVTELQPNSCILM